MRISKLILSLLVVAPGCAPTSRAISEPVSPPSPTPSDVGGDEPASADAGAEASVLPPELNARYAEETSAKSWVARFEREGREVRDRKTDVVAQLSLKPGQVVADIGAGTGLYTLDFARAVGPTGKAFAVDVQDYFLEHVRAKADEAKLTNVETVKATHKSVELDDASIDLAFFCDVYHHVEYPRTYLATVYAALRPGARLVVIDYVRPEPGQGPKDDAWLRDHIRASPQQFREEIEGAGFVFVTQHDLLEKNFFYIFEKPLS